MVGAADIHVECMALSVEDATERRVAAGACHGGDSGVDVVCHSDGFATIVMAGVHCCAEGIPIGFAGDGGDIRRNIKIGRIARIAAHTDGARVVGVVVAPSGEYIVFVGRGRETDITCGVVDAVANDAIVVDFHEVVAGSWRAAIHHAAIRWAGCEGDFVALRALCVANSCGIVATR